MGADSMMPTPPPGFTLDGPQANSAPPQPPPGFELDQPAQDRGSGKPQDWISKVYTPVIEGGAMAAGGAAGAVVGAPAGPVGSGFAGTAMAAAMYPPAKRFAASIDAMRGIQNPVNQPKPLFEQAKDVASDTGEGLAMEAGGRALSAGAEAAAPYAKSIFRGAAKNIAKVGSFASGAKPQDLMQAYDQGLVKTYGAPSMEEAGNIFEGAAKKAGVKTTPTLEATLDPQLTQARAKAFEVGQKLNHQKLPVVEPGAKVGDPHALYAYQDQFGPGGATRDMYNVYGDPNHPTIQKAGFGSSIAKEDVDKLGIPITGRQPNAPAITAQEALEARQAVDRIQAATPIKDRKTLMALGQLRDQFQDALSKASPDLQDASKTYRSAIVRNNLMKPWPVNKNGTPSKLLPALNAAGSMFASGAAHNPALLTSAVAYPLATSPLAAGVGAAASGDAVRAAGNIFSSPVAARAASSAMGNQALTQEKAQEYLRKANGDKAKAQQLARADGWSF